MNASSSATSSSRLKAGRSGTCEPVTSRRMAEMIRLQRVFFAACLACSPALSIVGVTPEVAKWQSNVPNEPVGKVGRSGKNCLRHITHPISASRVLPAFSSPSQVFGWFSARAGESWRPIPRTVFAEWAFAPRYYFHRAFDEAPAGELAPDLPGHRRLERRDIDRDDGAAGARELIDEAVTDFTAGARDQHGWRAHQTIMT